ncbi:thermophilic metalloprotease (M29) superfamily [Candidatus Kaiserbacteria bacterium RIFCSPHIGHO2_01_FULL_53_29]|uniref:Thermophilic metalloprotease (M29) superfamily n=1 Tax=Candidatus Kaiserbacteria bacterium RIFCSPHIGHO2_01_FULL_53_29 TaxID=1798480 RepID=A0A1F6CUF9_9BACT|nr:MAG: thermophilic metalloprotease (M29) superfamily [Candidatus Kaiserbacteria bacterium RIFCSPHIGHO2_01_FULL_53_29]
MSFKQPYLPSDEVLKKYADVLVNFALGGGKGIKKGEVVRVSASESAKPLYMAVCNAVVDAGGHVLAHYGPDDEHGDKRRNISVSRYFYEHATDEQIKFFPRKYLKGLVDQIDHSVFLLAEKDPHALKGVDGKRIMMRGQALKPFMDWRHQKEWAGKFTWTIALYGTPAMAKEAGLSEKEYWQQIIKACFLDEKNPIAKWKAVYRDIEKYRSRLNKLSPRIDKLHAVGPDMDIWYTLGEKRAWHAGSGRNIPSFEIFTSPDWRGTNGWIRINQPLYRYSNKITGIQLWFKNGRVVKSKAKTNEKLLKEMIATKNADKIGEYSLTDKRHSRITKFMAETLFDENIGGPYGNSHIALGMSYRDTYAGDVSKLTDKEATRLGFNDSSVHTDVISTTRRTVTAHLKNGNTKVIYKDGKFVL